MKNVLLAVLLAVLAGSGDSWGKTKAAKLEIGSVMPELDGLEWLQGSDPLVAEGEDRPKWIIYDCWAPWCGPCVRSIPHLSELADTWRDDGVAVVGIAIWDEPDNVRKFVEENGESMKYAVALDAGEAASERLMKASGQKGIPCAFIADARDNKLLWIGHPMTMDGTIKQIVAGVYDHEKALKIAQLEKKAQRAVEREDWEKAAEILTEWKELDPSQAAFFGLWIHIQRNDESSARAMLQELVEGEVDAEGAQNVLGLLMLARDRFPDSQEMLELVIEGAAKMAGKVPDDAMIQGMYWHVLNSSGRQDEAKTVLERLMMLSWDQSDKLAELANGLLEEENGSVYLEQARRVTERTLELEPGNAGILVAELRLAAIAGDASSVQTVAKKLLDMDPADADLLNTAAWELLNEKRATASFTDVSIRLAEKAETVTMGENPAILDTLALAEFRNGNIQRAIDIEKAAIAIAPDYEFFHEQLELFEEALANQKPEDKPLDD